MSSRRLRRWALRAGAVLLVLVLVVLGLQRHLVFPRHLVHAPDPPAPVEGRERLWLSTDGGEVEAWLLPGDHASPERPSPLVIFAHGNAELIDDWPATLRSYRSWGLSVLLVEYRGYGRSAGSPSEAAIAADLVAAHDLVTARPEIDAKRVILHGRSIGGGAVCALARQRPPAAIVLQSTFTSIRALAARWLIPGFLVLDPFDNEACLREYPGPVLIVHGRHDTLIPPAHAEALARAARRSRLVMVDAGHNDCPPQWSTFFDEVAAFLDAHGLR
ncbi:MAG: alpha/beta hydrolase [Myxococcales bacterium]|nr:alpha/beta hydrolase [Myxococcales bacterium]